MRITYINYTSLKNKFMSLKLKQKMKYLFLCIITSYMILFVVLYTFILNKNTMRYAFENNLNTMTSISNNLEAELNTMNNVSKLILTNTIINNYLDGGYKQGARYVQKAKGTLFDLMNTFNYIDSIYIFNKEGGNINVSKSGAKLNVEVIEDVKWYHEIVQAAGKYVMRVDGDGAFEGKEKNSVVSFIRLMNDIETQQPKGMLIINISKSVFENTYKDMVGNNKYFMYLYKEQLFCGNYNFQVQTDLTLREKNYVQIKEGGIGQKKVTGIYKIVDTPFTLIVSEQIEIGRIISKEASWMIGIILVLTFLSMSIIGLFISVCVTHPIEKLVKTMKGVKEGHVNKVDLECSNDEIGDLKDSYNEMIKEINKLIIQLINKEKSIQKAELEVLQEQIKPHFLYNTLDTIAYLALENKAMNVYEALETLGSFYRKFLSKGSKEITIEGEVEIIKDYLRLQKLRYEGVFEDYYNLDEELLKVKIPKLILQPLVENSLYHGLRPKGEEGVIQITIYKENEWIHIKIYDSGIGIDKEHLQSLLYSHEYKSFGLKGTIERIQHYYNRKDIFEMKSEEGIFTEIDIKIPALMEGNINV